MTLKIWHAAIIVFVLAASAVNLVVVAREHRDLGYAKPRASDLYAPYYIKQNLRNHALINRRGIRREILIVGFAGIAWFFGWFSASQKAKAV